jgi:hypothetical protein
MLRTDSSRLDNELRITNNTDEEMLDDQEDDGRTVLETERANKRLS